MTEQSNKPSPPRKSVLDDLAGGGRNIYCRFSDLSNEASVETFFLSRLLPDLGYKDSQIQPKKSLKALVVARGRKKEKYKPDYALMYRNIPRCIVDAKGTDEALEDWIEQCSGYCLSLNRKFPDTDPVRYFILSNGRTTALYQWNNDEPLLSLDFTDFVIGNPKFEHLKAIVGAQNVAKSEPTPLSAERIDFSFIRPTTERARYLFATCHKAIWKEGYGPGPAFLAFVKLMFVKLWADKNLRANPDAAQLFASGLTDIHLSKSLVTFSTEWIERRETEGAVNPIDTVFFDRLRDDIERDIQLRRKKRIFNKGERIGLRSDTVKDVVRRLEHFDMFGIDEDLNGRLFETFLNATMRGRELGQFFTPRSVVKMMTRLADLKVTRNHQDRVIDGFCGSGGFLIEALTIMRNLVRANGSLSVSEKEALIEKVSNHCLYGIDFGKDPPLARIARINMYLHGDGGSRIYYADTLDKRFDPSHLEVDAEVVENVEELRRLLKEEGGFDVVLTNPPFSMKKELKNESEAVILKQYELARKSDTSDALRPSLRSSVMSIERYYDLLKEGGRLITVIDDTLLSSGKFAYLRDFIRERYLIRAIVSLPGDAFRRSGSRVKTSVLLLEKKRKLDDEQPGCFAFFSEYLGIDDLTPRASDADVQESRTKAEDETAHIIEGYKAYLAGKSGPIVLKPEMIADRLDLKYCVPLFGRMAGKWRAQGIEVKTLDQCVQLIEDEIVPSEHPDVMFTLIKVTYDGICTVEKKRLGKRIKAPKMYRVRQGHLIFSTIRATDGAIGIVPPALDGALVAVTSYNVFNCGSAEDTAYLWAVLRSHEIRADMQSLSPGSGRYTSYWPDVGRVLIPWLSPEKRKAVGKQFLDAWNLEREMVLERQKAESVIASLGVESEDAKKRWNVSKAPK